MTTNKTPEKARLVHAFLLAKYGPGTIPMSTVKKAVRKLAGVNSPSSISACLQAMDDDHYIQWDKTNTGPKDKDVEILDLTERSSQASQDLVTQLRRFAPGLRP